MAKPVKPYVETIYNRPTLTTESEGLLRKEKTMRNSKDKNLLKRGKTWTCIYYEFDPIKGKKVPRWKGGFKTKAEARKAMVQLQAKADARGVCASKMTFKEYTEQYMKLHEGSFRPGTVRYYIRVLKYTVPIDDIPMRKITGEDIERVHQYMKASGKLSPQTIYKYLVQIKAIFNFAKKRDDIEVHPYGRFVMPRNKPVKHHSPTITQVKEMIEKSAGNICHLPIILAVMLGLRRGEIFGLRYDDFDFDNQTVEIQRQVVNIAVEGVKLGIAELKTLSSFRKIKVPESLLTIIKKRHEEHPENSFLFAKPEGGIYATGYIMNEYIRFRDENGFSGIRFHDLRHAYGTICLNQHVPMKVISDSMGHHNISVTSDVYCETQELLDEPAKVMEEKFGSLLESD